MPDTLNARLAVSSWSLHRSLERGDFTLLELPASAAAHGIGKLEICHFHFPSTDPGYVADLRGALENARVQFFTLLIDTGDITNADPARRQADEAAIAGWLDIASACGAQRARVIAGDSAPAPDGSIVARSAAALGRLARRASDSGVRLVTENWHALLDRPAEVVALLEALDDQVGLMLDFGNWKGARKYDDFVQIAPLAESTHAKAHYPAAGEIDREDFTRCLDICRNAGFAGPHSLIFDGPGDEWPSLDQMQQVVLPYLTPGVEA